MDYQTFITEIEREVKNCLPSVQVSVREVRKNNDVILQGMTLTEDLSNASPTIYMEEFYERYLDGDDLSALAEKVCDIYREHCLSEDMDFSFMDEYETVADKVFLRIVNREKNAELLRDVPYIPFLDLALIPYIVIRNSMIGNASTLIERQLISSWNVDERQVLEDGRRNIHDNYPYSLETIGDVLSRRMHITLTDEKNYNAMYVLSNCGWYYGAALMAVGHVMEEIADKLESNLYVIPSSIHEVIILPTKDRDNLEELVELVKSVNKSCVREEEILSDNAYYYVRGLGYCSLQ